ncbi:MAG: hypothetical protein LQ340_008080 [Diploschistes diacapsis]|nr:MAG: hypothetical protein LQ340_008080 [Diploschistes diacapsis]
MFTEPIVTFLALYNSFAYGLLFLYLDGVYNVFTINNGLSPLSADLTYLNLAVGVTFTFLFIPVQTYLYKRDRQKRQAHGKLPRPEARFLTSLVCVWLFPISLFWFAFTSSGPPSDPGYWPPIVAGAVLGFANPLLYLSMLNYLTDSYPHVAASAVAAFLIPSFLGAAGFAHVGVVMFTNMNTTWAVATLGFVSLGLVGLVYVVFFLGERLRGWSRLAAKR